MGNLQTVETPTDRISELPDVILSHILSLLPTTEAIRTSVLSKRFQYQCTSIDTLIFLYDRRRLACKFASLVNRTLSKYPKHNGKLKKFEFHPPFNKELQGQFNEWIQYAVDRNVEELVSGWFKIPKHLFTNSSLTALRLFRCDLAHNGQISWKRLRKLHLSWMNLSPKLIENILDGSPCLEILTLDRCYGFGRLDIKSMSMKKLVLYDYAGLEDMVLLGNLEVNAPYICSLKVKRFWSEPTIFLKDVSSLVEANLDFSPEFWVSVGAKEELVEQILGGFIERLVHVKKVTLSPNGTKVLSRLEAKGFRYPTSIKFITAPSNSDHDFSDDAWF